MHSIEAKDGNSLAGLRCVLYLGCYTGLDIESGGKVYNLMQETFNKGAHFVLATNTEIKTGDSNPFLRNFMKFISEGCTIEDAIDKAIDKLGVDSTFREQIVYIGDSKQILAN